MRLAAMILAAGRGERMRPLTDHTPKPLLSVAGVPLIERTISALVEAGVTDLVINHAWLGGLIEARLGKGSRLGARITWSPECPALETAGGIVQALPHLGERFLAVNADILCNFDYRSLVARAASLDADIDAHLVLVDNPPQHPQGDFMLEDAGEGSGTRLTFSGIGLYRARLFAALKAGEPAPLAPLLRAAIARRAISGEHHRGLWSDVGTPERLVAADALLRSHPAAGLPAMSQNVPVIPGTVRS